VANQTGKSYAMNVLTAMERPGWRPLGKLGTILKLLLRDKFFPMLQLPRNTRTLECVFWSIGKGAAPEIQRNLVELSFIHFARWVIIRHDQFPRLDPSQPAESLQYDWLFFESNFNGSWQEYIEAFSRVIPGGMDNIWNWSVKYPGSVPISPFLDYIRTGQADTDYYYNATPGSSTKDILGALDLQERLRRFATESAALAPADFRRAYDHFLISIQGDLGTTGSYPESSPLPDDGSAARRAPVHAS